MVLDTARTRWHAALIVAALSAAAPVVALGADEEAPPSKSIGRPAADPPGTALREQARDASRHMTPLVVALSALALASLVPLSLHGTLRRRLRERSAALDAANTALRDAERHADAGRDQLTATLNAIPDLMFEIDGEGTYVAVHATRLEHLVAPPESLPGRRIDEVLPADAAAVCRAALRQAHADGASYGRQFALALAGRTAWFELSVARKDVPGGEPTFVVLSRDITDRRLAEIALRRLNRLHAGMIECSQAIVRCGTEAELLREVCRAGVTYGGLRCAWIGMLDAEGETLEPVAQHGACAPLVPASGVPIDEHTPFGRGPVGTALRGNRPTWSHDEAADPSQPGTPGAEGTSWAALPLHRCGRVVGVLVLHADAAGAFDAPAQRLIAELVRNIDHTLDRFHHEAERARLAAAIAESEEKYRELAETVHDVIWTYDVAAERFLYVSPSVARLRGFSPAEVRLQTLEQVVGAEAAVALRAEIAAEVAALEAGRRGGVDFIVRQMPQLRRDGSTVWTEAVMNLVRDRRTHRLELHGTTRDITERRNAEAQIQKLAHFDVLTGLPNRALLQKRFDRALTRERRHGERLALMFLDLDRFKDINDTLGHATGDRVLVEIARRLSAALRETDTVARLGGDEFVVLLPNTDARGVALVARTLLDEIARPFEDGGRTLRLTGSIGIALHPDDGATADTLARCADVAMYAAKRDGRNGFRFYTDDVPTASARSLTLGAALHEALSRGQLSLRFQPQLSLADGRVSGVEALLRWQHPEFGAVAPAEFLPLVERSGLTAQIGEWVLREAVRQARQWDAQGLPPVAIAVNVSATLFRHPEFVARVGRFVDDEGLPPGRLELEVTEAATMDDADDVAQMIERLNARGVRITIDDFGTGYSSLGALRRFNVSKLKIDGSFVRALGRDPADDAIVSAIVNLGRSLGVRTVAESVETAQQLEFLRSAGCDEGQGHHFSRPLSAEAFAAFVRLRRAA